MGLEPGVNFLNVFLVILSSLSSTWGIFLQKIAQGWRLKLLAEYELLPTEELESEEKQKEKNQRLKKIAATWVSGLTLLIVVSFPLDTTAMNLMGQAIVISAVYWRVGG